MAFSWPQTLKGRHFKAVRESWTIVWQKLSFLNTFPWILTHGNRVKKNINVKAILLNLESVIASVIRDSNFCWDNYFANQNIVVADVFGFSIRHVTQMIWHTSPMIVIRGYKLLRQWLAQEIQIVDWTAWFAGESTFLF